MVIISWIKKIFSDLHSAIICISVTGLCVGSGSIYIFCKNLWIDIIKQLQQPTPRWATIALVVLLALLCVLKKGTPQSLESFYKPIYFEDHGLKWKIEFPDIKNNVFRVDHFPYCINHDLRYVKRSSGQYCCPKLMDQNCDSSLFDLKKIDSLRRSASAHADRIVRNSKDSCLKFAKNISNF